MKLFLIILNVGFLAGISFLWWQRERVLKKIFWPALSLKLLAGAGVGWIYMYYYPVGDTFNYFSEGVLLADLARNDFSAYLNFLWSSSGFPVLAEQVPRALFLSKIVSLLSLVTADNYWLIESYLSFLSFAGAWFLVRNIGNRIPSSLASAVIAFLFFPSIIFWSSGLIKESIAAGSLFFLSGIFIKIWFDTKVKWHHWIISFLAIWILWSLKYYFFAVFFPVVIASLLFKYAGIRIIKSRTFFSEILVWLILFLIPLSLVFFSHPNFYPKRIMQVVVENYTVFTQVSAPEDLIRFNGLEPTVLSLLQNAPWAVFSGLFRPFIWEAGTFFQFIVALENLLLLILFLLALYELRSTIQSPHRMLIVIVTVYIVLLCLFLTLSTPNFGTLARYRVGYLPYFALLMFNGKVIRTILQ